MKVLMQQSEENHVRRGRGRARAIVAAALLCTAALYQPNLASAAPHGGGGFHGGGFQAGGFRGADLAASTRAHFTPASFVADFMASSRVCTVVSGMSTALTGTMAGTMDATAGGGVAPGWDGLTTRIPGGVTKTTETTTTTTLTPPRPGTIVPIPQDIILM